jgi:hypothetical protein
MVISKVNGASWPTMLPSLFAIMAKDNGIGMPVVPQFEI